MLLCTRPVLKIRIANCTYNCCKEHNRFWPSVIELFRSLLNLHMDCGTLWPLQNVTSAPSLSGNASTPISSSVLISSNSCSVGAVTFVISDTNRSLHFFTTEWACNVFTQSIDTQFWSMLTHSLQSLWLPAHARVCVCVCRQHKHLSDGRPGSCKVATAQLHRPTCSTQYVATLLSRFNSHQILWFQNDMDLTVVVCCCLADGLSLCQ